MDGQIGSTIDPIPPTSAASRFGAVLPPAGLSAAIGSLLGAVAASSCCILPLVLFTLGISGAWIGDLTAFEPYQPVFIVMTLGFLGVGYYRVLRPPRVACAGGETCARPLPRRIVKSALWAATALVLAAIAFPYVAPPLLGV